MHISQTQCWTIERTIRALAGTFTLAGLALGIAASPWWLTLPALVGGNLVLFSMTGFCPAAVLLHRAGLPERCRS